jgi:hypothetical protein
MHFAPEDSAVYDIEYDMPCAPASRVDAEAHFSFPLLWKRTESNEAKASTTGEGVLVFARDANETRESPSPIAGDGVVRGAEVRSVVRRVTQT